MAKTHEFKGRIFTEIPKEAVEALGIKPGDEVEFKVNKKEVILLKKGTSSNKESLSGDERKLLEELMKIKHVERKKSAVKNIISENEKAFEKLLNDKILFKYKKSGEEMIGIDRNYYANYVKQHGEKDILSELEEKGWLILDDKKKIYEVNSKIEETGKQVKGVMGFDKKLYLVTGKKFNETKKRIEEAIEKPKSIEEVSEKTGLEQGLVKAVIELLKEQGEVIEKKKEIYQLI